MAPFYRPGAVDGYGRYYLQPGAGNVRNAVMVPQIGRRWHELPADFCGFGRDGYCYYNGVRAQKGAYGIGALNKLSWGDVFGPLEGWTRHLRTWGGPNYGLTTTNIDTGVVQTPQGANGVNWYYSNMLLSRGCYITSAPRWMIGPGDWEVELEWTNLTHTGLTNEPSPTISLVLWSGDCAYVAQGFSWVTAAFNPVHLWQQALGNWIDNYPYGVDTNGAGPQLYSGKMRIARTGNTYNWSYWEEGTWKVGGTPQTPTWGRMLRADYFYVAALFHRVRSRGISPDRPDAQVSNVKVTVNSGTIQHLASWALQPAGTHRGPRQDFPEYPLIVAADNEISIIDLDDPVLGQPALWLRLLRAGGDRLLGAFGNDMSPNLIFFDEGDLLIPYNPGVGYNGQIVASWPGNRAQHQGTQTPLPRGESWDSRANSGGGAYNHYRHTTSGLSYPNGTSDGLAEPFAGWKGELNEGYETINATSRASHLWTDGEYRYYAAAMGGANITRQHMERVTEYPMAGWTSHNIGGTCYDIKFSPVGHLVYCSATTIYVANKATWDAAWGTTATGNVTFTNDLAWTSPGTRSLDSQYPFAVTSEGVYVARDEGIYFRGWADGAWTLTFGDTGSGATYETLPSYTKITCVSAVKSGSQWIILAGSIATGPTYRALAVWAFNGFRLFSGDMTTELGSAPLNVTGDIVGLTLKGFLSAATGTHPFEAKAGGIYYTFQTEQALPPVVDHRIPDADAINVAADSTVSFDITDVNDDLDPDSVSIVINGVVVYEHEAAQNGYVVVRTPITKGYHYVVTAPTEWPYNAVVSVYVYAEDWSTASVYSGWSFTVAGDVTCFTGPLNATETALTVPFAALPYCERLRTSLFAFITTNSDVTEGARAIFLRGHSQELAPVLFNIVPVPTEEEATSRLCHKATNVAVNNNLRRKTDPIPGAIRELVSLGLPAAHRALLEAYAREGQPNTTVPLACVIVLLAKAFE